MTDLWKDLRAQHVGGSEVAALFDESPYLTRYKLWHIKNGTLAADNMDDVERIEAGKFSESAWIAWANHRWNTNFFQPGIYIKHPEITGMGCTPDALDRSNDRIMAQVKNVDSLQFSQKWDAEGENITRAPLDILLQTQHEIECADNDENHLIVVVGGNRLCRMICQRDRHVGSILRSAVKEFWDSIRSGIEPQPNFSKDGDSIRTIKSSLPVQETIDLSDWDYFRDLAARGLDATVRRGRANDDLEAINAEIIHYSDNARSVKAGEIILKFYEHRKNPKYIHEGEALK